MRSVFFIILAGMVTLSACKTFEPERELELPVELSKTFSALQKRTDLPARPLTADDGRWWIFLGSHELNTLVENALANNFDLKTLQTRLAQARANISKADAAFFPDLSFSLGGQKKGIQVKNSRGSGSTYDGSHSWDASFSSSYTLDIWGEARAESMSRVMTHEAAALDLSAATLDLTADIAETWVDIIAARNKQEILARQIHTNETLLELLRLRFYNGRASALEVSQQQEALAEAGSQVPLLEKQEGLLVNALTLLSGRADAGSIMVKTGQLPDSLPLPPIGIPSDLLERRPDIQAAKLRLSSAQWEISAARADLLPSFDITAQALFSSGSLDLLFSNWVASLAAAITGPLFDGGARRAEIERVKALAQEQVHHYAAAVAKAVLEVENSLISIQKQDEYVRLLDQELAVARIALKDARVQYLNGQSSYLNYLVTWNSIQRQERQLAGERANAVKERIGLHRSLGWHKPFSAGHLKEQAER